MASRIACTGYTAAPLRSAAPTKSAGAQCAVAAMEERAPARRRARAAPRPAGDRPGREATGRPASRSRPVPSSATSERARRLAAGCGEMPQIEPLPATHGAPTALGIRVISRSWSVAYRLHTCRRETWMGGRARDVESTSARGRVSGQNERRSPDRAIGDGKNRIAEMVGSIPA